MHRCRMDRGIGGKCACGSAGLEEEIKQADGAAETGWSLKRKTLNWPVEGASEDEWFKWRMIDEG